jgi:putative hydrolase of the HAD superfamily
MNKKTIIFDYGGVIEVSTEQRGILDLVAHATGLSSEDVVELYFQRNHLNNVGNNSQKSTILSVVETLLPGNLDAYKNASQTIDVYENSRGLNYPLLDVIKLLKAHGYTVALLSNYNSTLRDKIQLNGVQDIFEDNIFISSEIGLQKPDPKIFQYMFDKLGVEPKRCIFIDDSQKSLSTSKVVDYTPIQFISNDQLLRDLTLLGITVWQA